MSVFRCVGYSYPVSRVDEAWILWFCRHSLGNLRNFSGPMAEKFCLPYKHSSDESFLADLFSSCCTSWSSSARSFAMASFCEAGANFGIHLIVVRIVGLDQRS